MSVNTPRVWISPCFTGWETLAVAAALGALPIPASLLNKPLLIPCIKAAPTPPPANCSQPNALETIVSRTNGKWWRLHKITNNAKPIYPNAMTGTITLLTFAIRCILPNMMISVKIVKTQPTTTWFHWNALSNAAHSVLLCTELKAKPKVTVINTAKSKPIHLFFNPFSM